MIAKTEKAREQMQIVIDIPKDLYEGIERRDGALETEYVCDELMRAVDNGALLPKGHGDLKDVDKLKRAFVHLSKAVQGSFTDADIASIIYNSPTIIEADKSEDKYQSLRGYREDKKESQE